MKRRGKVADMSELVTFSTTSGTTFEKRADDPMVATLLSMYDEVGIPSVVELSGSVGEIVDEEYTHLERLIKRREILQEGVMTRAMQDLLNTTQQATSSFYEDEPLREVGVVYLSQVSRATRVFDVDYDLINFTVIDESTRLDGRLEHYRLLGSDPSVKKAIDRLRRDVTSPFYSETWTSRQLQAANTRRTFQELMSAATIQAAAVQANAGKIPYSTEVFALLFEYAVEEWKEEARLTELLYGILSNGLIVATQEGTTLAPQLIWEDLLAIMKGVELRAVVKNTINFFAGKAYPDLELLPLNVPSLASVMYTYDAPLLLSLGLALMPEDASPEDIGAMTIIDAKARHYQRLADTPQSIAQQVMNSAIRVAKSNTREPTKFVSRLKELIGRPALVRVLLSLLHYLELNPSDEEADRAAQAIERYLG